MRLWDTVAYRDRVRRRDEARRGREIIRPFVDELFSEGLDCSAVAGQVRDDASLSEPLRRAALNLVLKRCSQMREDAADRRRSLAAEWRAKLPTEQDAVASDPPTDEKQEE